MTTADWALSQERRLAYLGMLLFLFGLLVRLAASNFGKAVALFAVPRAALSAHLIALMQGTFLVTTGLLWPKLRLTCAASCIAFWLISYGFCAALIANVLAAVWGAGGKCCRMLPNKLMTAPFRRHLSLRA